MDLYFGKSFDKEYDTVNKKILIIKWMDNKVCYF